VIGLRPIAVTDAPAVAAAVNASSEALRRWMPWYRDDYDEKAARHWIEGALTSAEAGAAIQFAISHGEELVGVLGIEDIDLHTGRAMIGYWVATPAAGRGVGRRAIALALTWARVRPELRTVWAVVADANLASRRVLEVNQFRLVGERGIDERGDRALLYEVDIYPRQ